MLNRLLEFFLRLVYPPLCRHCQLLVEGERSLFCPLCLSQLSLIDLEGRCLRCGLELGPGGCLRCRQRRVVIFKQRAVVEPLGSAATLLRLAEGGDRKAIEAAAALMAYQYMHSEKKLPDLIVPLPGSRPLNLLALALGKILAVPVQLSLSLKWKMSLFLATGDVFHYCLNRSTSVADRHLLLCAWRLDDTQLRRAGGVLREGFPSQVDAIAFSE